MKPDREIVILEGARTPMADYNGVFSDVSAIDLGSHDQALTFLERAYEEREPLMGLLRVAPDLDTLHGEPRFAILLKKLKLYR